MGDSAFRGKPPPVDRAPLVYDVLAPKPGESWDLTLLDHSILGGMCHWCYDEEKNCHRTRPCMEPDLCPWHFPENRLYWLGFLAVYSHDRKRREILRISAESSRAFSHRHIPIFGLTGQRLKVIRPENMRTGRLILLASDSPPLRPIPHPHPLRHSLEVVFAVKHLPWDFNECQEPREEGR